MHYTVWDGVAFFEGEPSTVRTLGVADVRLDGMFASVHMKNLDDVKSALSRIAKSRGGNAITRFVYGQMSVGFWRSLLSRDDVAWYGAGQVAVVTFPIRG